MLETPSWFGDTRVTRMSRAAGLSPDALVMFHGFPGQPPAHEIEKYKNVPRMRVEAAKALVAAKGMDVYLPGYEGLGESRGTFGFHRSVTRSIELAKDLAERGYRKLHVAGHSWGGLVAFNAHRGLGAKTGCLALLAGLLDLENEQRARAWLPEYIKDYPEILGRDAGALDRAAADLERTRMDFNPLSNAQWLPEDRLLIVHGKPDTAVDVGQSRRFHRRAGGRYLEVDDDHVFSIGMPRIVGEIVRFFAA